MLIIGGFVAETPFHGHPVTTMFPDFKHESRKDRRAKFNDILSLQKAMHRKSKPTLLREKKKPSKDHAYLPFHSNSTAVVWRLPVGCDYSGFFVEVLGLLDAMDSLLYPNFYFDLGAKCSDKMLETLTVDERVVLTYLQNKSTRILDRLEYFDRKFVLIQHKQPNSPYKNFVGKNNPPLVSIGRAMSEQSKLGTQEVAQNEVVDELWVPTPWHQDIYAAHGITKNKIAVIPEAVDTTFFQPRKRRHRIPGVKFRFVSVFKWEHRKGFDALLQAYWEEFKEISPHVELVCMYSVLLFHTSTNTCLAITAL